MERDLDLLEGLQEGPILRLYLWAGDWVSYGFFQTEEEASTHFPNKELQFVKRPTGGGIVDHRQDLTYTLLVPKAHPLAKTSRARSYQRIHHIIHLALTSAGIENLLVTQEIGESPACFEHPVPGDIIDPQTRRKIAGAAQRRTRHGLLHQGSILAPKLSPTILTEAFANNSHQLLIPSSH
ncbi:MAG: lipoyl protein ligase domain-containing protein [Roseibacillus sp.]